MAKIPIVFVLLFMISGCSPDARSFSDGRYEIHEVGNETYVLNVKTGALFRVEEGRKVEVKAERATSLSPVVPDILRLDGTIATTVTVTGSSKIVGDTPKIRGMLQPFIEEFRELRGGFFSINFVDEHGFRVGSASVRADDLVRQIGSDGQPEAWSFQVDVPLSAAAFRLARRMEITWSTALNESIEKWTKSVEGVAWKEARDKAEAEALAFLESLEEGKSLIKQVQQRGNEAAN